MRYWAGLLTISFMAACGPSYQVLEREIDRTSHALNNARNTSASRCTPYSLAVASSQIDFAKAALQRDETTLVRTYLELAWNALEQASDVVDSDLCEETFIDTDKDGVPDTQDQCPADQEDFDGFEDANGCPDKDNDADSVLDGDDKCPFKRGYAVNNGCPVDDRDGDGIYDKADSCPDVPEDQDGVEDQDGCPEDARGDKDGDKIPDKLDACPTQAEDFDGFADTDGCPDSDNDLDTVLDVQDKCPNEFGPAAQEGCGALDRDQDGFKDNVDLCPDLPGKKAGCPPRVWVTKTNTALVLKKPLMFSKENLKGAYSNAAMLQVATILRVNPQLKISIHSQTRTKASAKVNYNWSQARALALKQWLVEKAIDPSRIEIKALGDTLLPVTAKAQVIEFKLIP